ncbi:MAG TPA: dTDP-4-dehydrorhamnose reductase [candidate division WOR-3 bacterium]|uniref:dTDP-4-dehydrorhamnose reductase n=1 Tax=candidate division WOR-3 bacterium TaxID=2052148 RepID=A0A7C0ZCA0_UNCW3|nr:dTDP-4-dehydrorhamnose reductase [candidate division WOR-3 bacterium]
MKIAITGANGQLGSDLVKELSGDFEVVPLTHEDIEIGDPESQRMVLSGIKPDVLINTAAFHNVPKCEEERDTAYRVNGYALKELAMLCNELGTYLIHISTDYVFDGSKGKPYVETDTPNPLNTYGISKLVGELYIKNYSEDYAIVRVSGLYGLNPCRAKGGRNFVETMVYLAEQGKDIKVVDDQFITPTFTLDVARQMKIIVKNHIQGIIHCTNEGETNWYEFARAIFDISGVNARVFPRKTDPDREIKRPTYSVLENAVLKERRINIMKHWKEALREYLSLRG